MTKAIHYSANSINVQRAPGYLMAPFGWAAVPVGLLLEADPSLYPRLFTLSRRRMHLIALALSCWVGKIDAQFARLLITGAPSAVLEAVLRRWPNGLKRALGHLPVRVLPQASYLQLIELLNEPATSKLIYHVNSLQEEYLGLLHNIPAPLRRIAAGMLDDLPLPHPEGLVEGLRFLSARGAAPSFEALVTNLAVIRQPAQFVAHIGNLVQRLPLPDALPPQTVGAAQRLDGVAEICRLAKRWKNCLADCYLDAVNDGRSAVYLWQHVHSPAVCVVTRHGRVGWALEAAKGPENAELPPIRLKEIQRAFEAAGIPGESAVEVIEHCARARSVRAHGLRRRRRIEAAELDEIYEELEAA